MSDIISARCFGCGNIIKVPAGLGGKKARCPQCTNTITIPMPNDTQFNDFISDDQLPEVAREGEIVRAEEGEAPIPGTESEPAEQEDPTESRRKGGTSVRGRGSPSGAYRAQPRSGVQPRYTAPSAAPAPKSSAGMMVGIAMGVLALVILVFVLSNSGGHAKPQVKSGGGREKEKEKENPFRATPQYSPEEQVLVSRLLDYTGAVNRGDPAQILKFYTYDPEDERKLRIRIAQELVDPKVTYENVKITSVSSANGSITFSYGAGSSKTLQWKQVGDVWLIAEMPGH